MKGRWQKYTAAELAWIKAHSTLPRRHLHQEFQAKFSRPDVSQSNLSALCKRQRWLTGRNGRYEKGRTPENKGKRMPFNPKSAATQFRKGHVPANLKPFGDERLTRDGYVEIKIDMTNPHTGFRGHYVQKHRWLWECANGPVPEGMRLKCLDGDKTNTDPANWKAIPLALAPRLNGRFGRGYDAAPAVLKPTIMKVAELEHAAREKRKETRS